MSDFELIRGMYESNSNWILYLIICNAIMFIIIVGLIMALSDFAKRLKAFESKENELSFKIKGKDLISVINKNIQEGDRI